MAQTRAQSAAQKGGNFPKDQGGRPQDFRRTRRKTARSKPHPAAVDGALVQQNPPAPVGSKGLKRRAEDSQYSSPELSQKRPRILSTSENIVDDRTAINSSLTKPFDPVGFWAREKRWPIEYFDTNMERALARKRSFTSLGRKRSSSATSTPSDQKPREEKSTQYRDSRYETLLNTKGIYMETSELGIVDESKNICQNLLRGNQAVPQGSIFDDAVFEKACKNIQKANEARVIQDISRLVVPSAETLALYDKRLAVLKESVNEGWNNSIPVTGTRPQPDYSVGFRREAFTEDQLAKLSPFIGDFIAGDLTFFMATYYIYFPFLTCEVKCGAAALDVADRQNAHSMTLAVRGIVELFRLVGRENEVHRQILGFSISHDHRSVRIYGYYPVIEGKDTKYYRHPIRTFDFTEMDGKEKWTAYRFTMKVYDAWMPDQFKRVCSAIDQLPSKLNFHVPALSESAGLSQDLGSYHLTPSEAEPVSLPVEGHSQLGKADQRAITPNTSFTDSGTAKRRKGQGNN
ncbi:hypothetical protein VM1G_10071 [Cytospora mali]|uniref:DUF7924 domain-containing protein n=1 Tax=Cytospora mali TaxID=578113 RepID=A0A194WEE3_CYTMA|nr:hypothetical protein VM1G_10071 [Valsa mali]